MRIFLQITTAAAALAALGLLASGCGGGSSSNAGVAQLGTNAAAGETTTTTPSNAPASRQDLQAAVLAFAKCMRANGVSMPDPTFGGGGGGGGGLFRQSIPRNSPKVRAAMDKCRSKLDAVRPQFTPEQQEEFQARALRFAQCMRKNGVNVPDPDFSQGGPGGGVFRNIDPDSPKVRKAFEKCQQSTFGNSGRRGGGGGFFFGGPPPSGGGNG